MGLSDEQRRELCKEQLRAFEAPRVYYENWKTLVGGCPYHFEVGRVKGWWGGTYTSLIRRDMTNFGDVK